MDWSIHAGEYCNSLVIDSNGGLDGALAVLPDLEDLNWSYKIDKTLPS